MKSSLLRFRLALAAINQASYRSQPPHKAALEGATALARCRQPGAANRQAPTPMGVHQKLAALHTRLRVSAIAGWRRSCGAAAAATAANASRRLPCPSALRPRQLPSKPRL